MGDGYILTDDVGDARDKCRLQVVDDIIENAQGIHILFQTGDCLVVSANGVQTLEVHSADAS